MVGLVLLVFQVTGVAFWRGVDFLSALDAF